MNLLHANPYMIQFYLTYAGEQIFIAVDKYGFVVPFQQGVSGGKLTAFLSGIHAAVQNAFATALNGMQHASQ